MNKDIRFSNIKGIIINGLIFGIGLYLIIVEKTVGNFVVSLAVAMSMIIYCNIEKINYIQYLMSCIPIIIGTFGIFYFISGYCDSTNKLGLSIIFIIFLLMFDFNIWKGKNLNAIGIVISIYVILISLFGKRYFYDYISDFFTIIMVLFFSKGIKNVFKQVVETEVDKNSKKISDKNFLQLYANHQFSAPYLWLNHTNTDFLKRFNTTDGGVNLHLQLTPRLKFNLYEYAIDEYYRADTEQYNYKDESKATSRRWFQVAGLTFAALQSGVVVELNNGIDLCKSGYRFGVMDGSTRENRLYTSLAAKYFVRNLGFQAGLTHQYTRVNFYGTFPKYFYDYSDEAEDVTADDKLYNRVWEGYFYCKYTPVRHLLFSGAVRKNIPEASQPDYISWQVAGRWNMNEKFSLLLSAGKYHTYNVPAYNSQNFALHSSRQYSVDLTSHIYDFDLKLSSYLKNENTRDYFAENGKEAVVERRLKGLEFSVARTIGRFSFAGSYTFIDSRVRLGKKSYRSANDMDYIIRTSIVWRTANQWNIGINFSARPGLYYTPVEYALNISDNVWFPLYGDYNSEQVTAYHSLDLTVNKIFPLNKGHLLAFFTITNMLDKSNRNYPVYSTDYKSVLGWEEYQRRLVYVGLQFNF